MNSNEKGASFERLTCQRLSLWVSNLEREDVFWRSAMSGGRATLASRRKGGRKFDAQCGDINAIHAIGDDLLASFVIECKHYKNLAWDMLIYGHIGHMTPIWEKLLKECEVAGDKLPILIARQNRKPDLLVTNRTGRRLFKEAYPDLEVRVVFPIHGMHAFLFADLLRKPFDTIRKTCKERLWHPSSPLISTSPQDRLTSTDGKSSPSSRRRLKTGE